MLGRRLRPGADGTRLGVILGFAWAAYPFTDYALQSNSNDALVAALLVWALVALRVAGQAGACCSASPIAAKFAPLPLAPLFAAGETRAARRAADGIAESCCRRLRPAAVFCRSSRRRRRRVMLALPAIDPGLATFYDRTVKSQIDRTSPFSVWGQDQLARVAPDRGQGVRGRPRVGGRVPSPPPLAAPRSPRSPPR